MTLTKFVVGFPNYLVRVSGEVWSLRLRRPLRPFPHNDGHLFVDLCSRGVKHRRFVHVVVLEAFVGPRPTAVHQARHLNGNPADNRAVNLAWGTAKENQGDRVAHGTSNRGKRYASKLTPEQVRAIRRRLANDEPCRMIACDYGVTYWAVHAIKTGRTWRDVQ
jgi:hypothetical protein